MTPDHRQSHPDHRGGRLVRDPAAASEAVVEDQDPTRPAHHAREDPADLLLHRARDHPVSLCGFSGVPRFADYPFQPVLAWLGAAMFAASLWLFYRVHRELGRNWSDSLEVREQHKLVTDGLYRYVRHPMYTAFFMWARGAGACCCRTGSQGRPDWSGLEPCSCSGSGGRSR